MKKLEYKIDELLISLIPDVDEWEGGLLCTPKNRDIVSNWLAKYHLTKHLLDKANVSENPNSVAVYCVSKKKSFANPPCS